MLASVSVLEWLQSLLPVLGAPLVLALFYVDGMVLGKFLPPSAVYVGYLALARPSGARLLVLVLACVAAITLGQWTLYRTLNPDRPALFGLRRRFPWIAQLPTRVRGHIGEQRMLFLSRNFDRFGGAGLAVTNVVPGIRSLMTIPAGIARYPVRRFLLFSTLGNVAYVLLLTLAGQWLVTLLEQGVAAAF